MKNKVLEHILSFDNKNLNPQKTITNQFKDQAFELLNLDKIKTELLYKFKTEGITDEKDFEFFSIFLKNNHISRHEFILNFNYFLDNNKKFILNNFFKKYFEQTNSVDELLIVLSLFGENLKSKNINFFKSINIKKDSKVTYLNQLLDIYNSDIITDFTIFHNRIITKIYQDFIFGEVVNNLFFQDINLYNIILNLNNND